MTQLRELNQAVTTVTEPSKEPISLPKTKTHLQYQVDTQDVDSHLNLLIRATRRWAEQQYTGRAFIDQTLLLTLDDLPGDTIKVPRPPLSSVNSVKLLDEDGTTTIVSSSKYRVNTDNEPGKIVLKDDESWPSFSAQSTQGVEVEFDAGYGPDRKDVPEDIRTALLQHVKHLFDNRSPVTEEGVPREVPFTVESLLMPYRIWQF